MPSILIQNATLINEGKRIEADVYIVGDRIFSIGTGFRPVADRTIDARGLWLLPGVIDDQVHFREPGLTHKGDLTTESRAAVAGGVTTYMEMPNTRPSAVTQELLEQKYQRAAEVSLANYSFYIGANNHNLEELLRTDGKTVCGIKIFMGSSTGDLLVDDPQALEGIFRECKLLIATHCEYDPLIKENAIAFREKYGEDMDPALHADLRSAEACWLSSSYAVELATKHNTRLHILHISTARELSLFRNDIPLSQKRITAEACIHHLSFARADYARLGNLLKWNPAVKEQSDQDAIWEAVLDNRIDVIATDHAPHTLEEKQNSYFNAPSGGPLIQHTLLAMLEHAKNGRITPERVVEKMSHAVADMFQIDRRGYIREGYYADLVLVDPNAETLVTPESLHHKVKWSPFMGTTFHHRITHTIVSGHLAYQNDKFDESTKGQRLAFDR
jgi:dihydroorotase